jgi:hypothetical protein
MIILSMAIVLGSITLYMGTGKLVRRTYATFLLHDHVTVNAIEDRIREIRIENKKLEDELAALKGSDSSN